MGLTYDPGCAEFIASLPPTVKKAARAALGLLDGDPRARGLDWKRLETAATIDHVYRVRVGDYRIAYVLRGAQTRVVRVFHRREGYRWLERLGF